VRFNCSGYVFKSKPTGSDYEYLLSSLQTMQLTIETPQELDADTSSPEEVKKLSHNDAELVKDIRAKIKALNENKKVQAKEHLILMGVSQSAKVSQSKVAGLLREFSGVHWSYKQKRLTKKKKELGKVFKII